MRGIKMLHAKDYRRQAWEKLRGKWGTAALATLVQSLILGACAALSYVYVGGVALFLITGPLALGYTVLALHVIRAKEARVENLFSGFRNFGAAFLVNLINGIFIFLWSLLLFIPGIIKTYSYRMSYYVLADNPEISANEARKRSMQIMRGNKWRLFCLDFSFIGWWLLTVLTLGILSFWIQPYKESACAAFYSRLIAAETEEAAAEVTV